MSTLKADTIVASDGSSPVTLTKQEAVKFWVNYDAVDQATDGSLNQSSLTDETTGRYYSSFTSNFSSAVDKCVLTNTYNTTDGGSTIASGAARGLSQIAQGGDGSGNIRAQSTSEVQYSTAYGAHATSDGASRDMSGTYVAQLGDLA